MFKMVMSGLAKMFWFLVFFFFHFPSPESFGSRMTFAQEQYQRLISRNSCQSLWKWIFHVFNASVLSGLTVFNIAALILKQTACEHFHNSKIGLTFVKKIFSYSYCTFVSPHLFRYKSCVFSKAQKACLEWRNQLVCTAVISLNYFRLWLNGFWRCKNWFLILTTITDAFIRNN